jgi:fluoride ion exporter CrcB/FEX
MMYLVVGSLFGVLFRLALSTFEFTYISGTNDSALLSNILGLFILGLNQGGQNSRSDIDILIESGLCGSLTSWATWIIEVILIEQTISFDHALFVFITTFALFNFAY